MKFFAVLALAAVAYAEPNKNKNEQDMEMKRDEEIMDTMKMAEMKPHPSYGVLPTATNGYEFAFYPSYATNGYNQGLTYSPFYGKRSAEDTAYASYHRSLPP